MSPKNVILLEKDTISQDIKTFGSERVSGSKCTNPCILETSGRGTAQQISTFHEKILECSA